MAYNMPLRWRTTNYPDLGAHTVHYNAFLYSNGRITGSAPILPLASVLSALVVHPPRTSEASGACSVGDVLLAGFRSAVTSSYSMRWEWRIDMYGASDPRVYEDRHNVLTACNLVFEYRLIV